VLITNLATWAMGFCLFAFSVVFPQLLQLPRETGVGLGLSLVGAGLVIAPSGLMMMALSPVAGRLERRWGPKVLLTSGASVIACSYAVAVLWHDEVWQILGVNLLFGVGIGLGFGAMPALVIGSVRDTEMASANGFNTLMRSLGTAFASAVVGSALAASHVSTGGITGPSQGGFMVALVLGGVSAVLCLVLAAGIPRPQTMTDRAPAPEAV
jgi:MFS family permease